MWVLVKRKPVANAFGPEENSIKEVFVGGVAVAERFAGMEEKWDINHFLAAILTEPEDLGDKLLVRAAEVFLADQVKALRVLAKLSM